jgi:polyisoprenoid-binding protein YceI
MLSSATIEADLSQLTSDDSRRDGAIRTQALETNTFPDASFVLTAPVDLGVVPGAGESFTVEATGDLTIHGVTRTVTVPINGQLVGDTVVVVGSVEITFADYDIDKPSAGIVLSVDDVGGMEFQLFLARP